MIRARNKDVGTEIVEEALCLKLESSYVLLQVENVFENESGFCYRCPCVKKHYNI